MMSRIVVGIYDDSQEAILELRRCIEAGMYAWEKDFEIKCFSSGEELLKEIEELKVVFLDIDMPVLDGIQTGKEILKLNPQCKIIIATGIVERFKEVFQLKAVRFVTKPFVQAEVTEALEAVLNNDFEKTIHLYLNRNAYQILQREITYVRAFNGYTEYAVKGHWMRKDVTLETAEQMLDARIFARISRQFIVNLAYVEKYKNGEISFDGQSFRVSRRNRKNFEHKYIEYDLKYRKKIVW